MKSQCQVLRGRHVRAPSRATTIRSDAACADTLSESDGPLVRAPEQARDHETCDEAEDGGDERDNQGDERIVK